MERIGIRTYKCKKGEEITINFDPEPDDCIGKITFDFIDDDSEPQRVQNDEIQFVVNENTDLIITYFFNPEEFGAICKVMIRGEGNSKSPDIIDFSPIPPNPIYVFVSE